MSPRAAWYMARAIAGSSSAKMACRTLSAAALPARVGIAETTSRSRWTTQRCHAAPGKTSRAARTMPPCASEVTHRTPSRPRSRKPAQEALPAGVGLGVDAGEADHPADSVLADGDGDGGGHRGGGAVAAAPARRVGGVHPRVREAPAGQVAPPQLGHLGVELEAYAAHAVLG